MEASQPFICVLLQTERVTPQILDSPRDSAQHAVAEISPARPCWKPSKENPSTPITQQRLRKWQSFGTRLVVRNRNAGSFWSRAPKPQGLITEQPRNREPQERRIKPIKHAGQPLKHGCLALYGVPVVPGSRLLGRQTVRLGVSDQKHPVFFRENQNVIQPVLDTATFEWSKCHSYPRYSLRRWPAKVSNQNHETTACHFSELARHVHLGKRSLAGLSERR